MSFIKPMKRIGASAVMVIMVFVLFFEAPEKAHAQWPVFDVVTETFQGSQFAKEFVGDSLANFIAKTILQKLTAQTVNWINSGFKGNPMYVTNTGQFFLDVGDNMASKFLSGTSLNSLCSPFKAQVRLALVKNYLQETDNQNLTCTLGNLEQNYSSFVQSFDNGGWDSWFIVTQNDQNNPYGAYLEAKNQMSIDIGNASNKYQKQLDWGKGFLSYEKCVKTTGTSASSESLAKLNSLSSSADANSAENLKKINLAQYQYNYDKANEEYLALFNSSSATADQLNAAAQKRSAAKTVLDNYISQNDMSDNELDNVDTEDTDTCAEYETVTPGSVINDQLSKALGSTWENLNASDEINEVVSALMQQLTSKVVGGISSGLRGLSSSGSSSSSSSSSSRTFLEQMVDATASTSAETTEFKSEVYSSVPSNLGGTAEAIATTTTTGNEPIITLAGDNPMNLTVGDTFTEPGAYAADQKDGDISSKIETTGSVNMWLPGTYIIKYNVTDSDGYVATTVTRTVNVTY